MVNNNTGWWCNVPILKKWWSESQWVSDDIPFNDELENNPFMFETTRLDD